MALNKQDYENILDFYKTPIPRTYKEIKEKSITLVSESGLFTREDLALVNSYGAEAVLVGESLMSQKDILYGVKKLIGKI